MSQGDQVQTTCPNCGNDAATDEGPDGHGFIILVCEGCGYEWTETDPNYDGPNDEQISDMMNRLPDRVFTIFDKDNP